MILNKTIHLSKLLYFVLNPNKVERTKALFITIQWNTTSHSFIILNMEIKFVNSRLMF